MADKHLRIGIYADLDPRLYEFQRRSGLPRDAFDQRTSRWDTAGDIFAVVVSVGGLLLALLCGWGGQ